MLKMILQILASCLLLPWPLVMMTSVMIFDAPGSTDNMSAIRTALCVAFYPLVVGLIFFVLRLSFWGLAPKWFLTLTFLIPLGGALLFGYPRMYLNASRGISSNGYFTKNGVVYYGGSVIDADAASFRALKDMDDLEIYAADKNKVYYYGRVIPEADPQSFKLFKAGYYTDKSFVFYEGKKIPHAKAGHLELLKDPEGNDRVFLKDGFQVFYMGRLLPEIDSATARLISPNYLVDRSHVLFLDRPIAGADARSFKLLPGSDEYGLDDGHVYFRQNLVTGADPKTFKTLNRGYAKDARAVYIYGRNDQIIVLEGADPKTFEATEYDNATGSDAKDRSHYYLSGKVVK